MTPKLTPLPPCTARPDGLLRARIASSSNRIACSSLGSGGGVRGSPLGEPHRRQAQLVALLQPVFGLGAPLVDPDLAAAQDPVDVALRHAFQYLQQVVIDALAGIFRPNLMSGHDIFA